MRVVLILVLCLLTAARCSDESQFAAAPEIRTPLIDGIPSFSSIDETAAFLKIPYSAWQIRDHERASKSADGERPSSFMARIHNYRSAGHPGDLLIFFIGDRLLGMHFYPENMDAYLRSLGDKFVALGPWDETDIGKNTHFRIDRSEGYVAWSDKRLSEWLDLSGANVRYDDG